jgi:hypothetical protein
MFEASSSAVLSRISFVLLASILSVAAVAGVTFSPRDAQAQAAKGPDKKTKDAARKAYGAGEKAYGAGDYAAAVENFKKADEMIPSPHAKYWVAKSLDKQQRTADAISAYQALLSDADASKVGEDKLDEARNRIKELQGGQEGEVVIKTAPAGATVTVDGTAQTGEPPFTVKLAPGKHKIAVSASGFETKEVEVEVTGGGTSEQSIELMPATAAEPTAPPPPPVAEPGPQPPPPAEKKSKIPAYVTLGIAGVGAIVGTIFGIQALSAKSDFDDHPTTEAADDVERNALIADISFGVALTLGVTGIVLLTSASSDEPDTAKAAATRRAAARLNVAPVVSPTTAGAAARLTF